MLSRLREHLGSAGLVVAIVALVAALAGGAIAANGGSDGKATASAKGKPGPRGKTGKTGPQGPAGPAGPAGPQGPAGAKGDTGAAGSNGAPGADGKSVTGEPIAAGGACGAGVTGVKYTLNATSTNVCNGKQGAQGEAGDQGEKGEKGDPWSVGGTLPSGATETGTFFFRGENKEGQTAPFGWPIPLSVADAAAISPEEDIHVVDADGAGTCTGTSKNPTAPPGELCFYKALGAGTLFTGAFPVIELAHFNVEAEEFSTPGISPAGGLIYSEESTWSTSSWVQGSFAITAP